MVHIKRIELSHFKSFGGTTKIPFLPGFTVISGPNGSGKSNILDALLFCLNLSTSKGMRAERLPDLVNHDRNNNGRVSEAIVTVTFDLSEWEIDDEAAEKLTEFTVTRRLRVGKNGNYSSTFYVNGQLCNATELQQQLNRLRIYPEGYNVVLQGDVTRIITMNGRERREIIDELAGVAQFDRQIEQTKQTLETVREKQERYRFVEQELQNSCIRLDGDRAKAEKYQKLKVKIHEKQELEAVLNWRSSSEKLEELLFKLEGDRAELSSLSAELSSLVEQIELAQQELNTLDRQVKALGEDEHLSVASQLATQKAKLYQLQQRREELIKSQEQKQVSTELTVKKIEQFKENFLQISNEKEILNGIIPQLTENRERARSALMEIKAKADAIATASEAWVQEQTALSRQATQIQDNLNPLRSERDRLSERQHQLTKKVNEQTELLVVLEPELKDRQIEADNLTVTYTEKNAKTNKISQELAITEHDLVIQQDTQKRLSKEQRDKQRELDRLEATKQAQQEAQGTYSTQVIFNANLEGVCGLVAQLGQVEPRYQLALETAAGSRIGNLVVENDRVAQEGIELLKLKKAGRATFLPLNKIQSQRAIDTYSLRNIRGFIDLAVNLIECESRYEKIFSYVFGNTLVFSNLNEARAYIGQHRIVTLEGDILELTGAMTGGSVSSRSSLHFGTVSLNESEELENLRRRLNEIESMLVYNDKEMIQKSELVKQLERALNESKQEVREQQLLLEQLRKEIQRLDNEREKLINQIASDRQELEGFKNKLEFLAKEIPERERELQELQNQLSQLENSQIHSEWQQIQNLIKTQEVELQEKERLLRETENSFQDLENKQKSLEEKIEESQIYLADSELQQVEIELQLRENQNQSIEISEKIANNEKLLQEIADKLGQTKIERDRAADKLKQLQERQQKQTWEQQKLQENQAEKQQKLENLQQEIKQQQNELPECFAEKYPPTSTGANLTVQLEQLQKELRSERKKLEAMEPVNMLALEEYERTQNRLQELSEKLATLEAERTELLLRIEKFTTLRFKAFKEAFDAVNENFQSIFATLSDGDGYLQLDDPEDPLNGGLNLVAHPKGKPVQRLTSMSGGEKSLTALSFIFALQRYRPSPFYAFDEVDMFLDGANVERLAKMIEKQARQAQFLVVSLRRPTIESSQRTIGVTQARGAHTQVLGIKL
jgi:chromosome segregation protein